MLALLVIFADTMDHNVTLSTLAPIERFEFFARNCRCDERVVRARHKLLYDRVLRNELCICSISYTGRLQLGSQSRSPQSVKRTRPKKTLERRTKTSHHRVLSCFSLAQLGCNIAYQACL
jgi:hypothetical protein